MWKGSTGVFEPTGPPQKLFLEANRDKVAGPGPRVSKRDADGGLNMLFSLINHI